MPSWTQNYYHAVFSTKHREPLITPELETRLFPFIGGIVRDLRCSLLAVNGSLEHVHVLIRYRPDLSHSDLLMNIKSRSSKWIHNEIGIGDFAWQENYGGFTVSKSVVSSVQAYIERQKEHHRRQSFKDEFLELLRRHEIEFDHHAVFQ
ncbi:MAG: IS200/IS605 family transposase [Phycisphaeraceae bacterium]|nr:IS200/IS605 family transposase [Phycisphaeraceae bacterium]